MSVNMRRSKVLEKLRSGGVATSFKINFASARICEMACSYGFDSIWLCLEHVPDTYSEIEKMILAAKAHDTDTVVRVARGSYNDYIKPLEMDATGIMVPHIISAEDARQVVKMTKFHPVGLRAIDGGNADGMYCRVDLSDYLEQANKERFVIVQIEDVEPLGDLEEICQIDGIDMIYFGPADFSHSLGIPGRFDDKRISETRKLIADTANKYGKFAGTVGSADNYNELVDLGYKYINVGVDIVAMNRYCKDIAKKINL